MSIMKRMGWMLIGIVVGALLTTSVGATRQQGMDTSRLRVTVTGTPMGMAAFVKDTRSAGCWLVFSRDTGTAISPAPAEACLP